MHVREQLKNNLATIHKQKLLSEAMNPIRESLIFIDDLMPRKI